MDISNKNKAHSHVLYNFKKRTLSLVQNCRDDIFYAIKDE